MRKAGRGWDRVRVRGDEGGVELDRREDGGRRGGEGERCWFM
jgi:hypothetical protein